MFGWLPRKLTLFGWTVARAPRKRTLYLPSLRTLPDGRRIRQNAREAAKLGGLAVGDSFTTLAAGRLAYERRSFMAWLGNKPRVLRRFTVERITKRYIAVSYVD